MAIDKKLQIFDDEGNPVDYDILASDVKFNDGKDLPNKLAEMEEEIGEGGYTPPAGGIPKADLAPSVQTSLGLADTALQSDDKTQLQNAINSLQSALDTLIGSGNVQGAIDTFNEVKAFLEGISSSDTLAAKLATLVPQSRTINEKPLTSNIVLGINDIDGLAAAIAAAGNGAVSVIQPDPADGTFIIRVGSTDYTINLNHTHENMAKLIVCEESDLPSTLDNSTIYAITDSGETEIEKLIIRGMEFAGGGGTPSTDPRIVSPIGTQIDFNGESTKTVTVRASNLSEALTIAVTGATANLQTISANDAANGVQLTLTKGQNFNSGTLRIYSSEVDKSWDVIDSQALQLLTAIKLTGSQWLQTDYKPNANTEFELDVLFDNYKAQQGTPTPGVTFLSCAMNTNTDTNKIFRLYTDYVESKYKVFFANEESVSYNGSIQSLEFSQQSAFMQRGIIKWVKGSTKGSIQFGGLSHDTSLKTTEMQNPLRIGYGASTNAGEGAADPDTNKIYKIFDATIYGIKITEGGTTVRNYVPATHFGVPGLHDTITGAFISSETSTPVVAIE